MEHLEDYGSLLNVILANSPSGEPTVGHYCTVALWTDRHVYDVVWVSDCKRKALIRRCIVTHDSTKEGGIGHQNWKIEQNDGGECVEIHLKNGSWFRTESGERVAIVFNVADEYYDWSF